MSGGLSFYQRREIKDVLSLLRIVEGGADFLSFQRTINLPRRGFGEVALTKLRDLATVHNMTIFPLCEAIVDRTLSCSLSQKQKEGLAEYVQAIRTTRVMLQTNVSLHESISQLIERTRYLEYLRDDPETFVDRRENVDELLSKAAMWEEEQETPTLHQFLEELSLKSATDETHESDCVKLMTLHNSKGLEFICVALVGMEEDLFPHVNSRETNEQLEEERRLCYVGMTRAKDYLYLTAAKNRYLWGTPRIMRPSRFFSEVPLEYLEKLHKSPSASSFSSERSYRNRFQERHYEEQEESNLPVGTRVEHRDFGVGIIQKSYHTSLGLTYDVLFSRNRYRTFACGKVCQTLDSLRSRYKPIFYGFFIKL